MESPGNGEGMAAWRVLMEAHAVVVDAIEKELQASQGLPLTWFEVLFRLAQTPEGALRMQDLAARLLFSRSGVTRLVDRLEAGGLVERASCPADRRGTYAVITAPGRAALERAQPEFLRAVDEHFARHLARDEAGLLTSALAKVVEASGSRRADEDCDAEPSAPR